MKTGKNGDRAFARDSGSPNGDRAPGSAGSLPFGPLSVGDHRADREAGSIVYPVLSRRSKGLSVGVNLFPDRKLCSFDCPYCEVFPFSHSITFSLESMERGIRTQLAAAESMGLEVRDIAFSGNGEPTLSPSFEGALALAVRLRAELCPSAALVVITNGSTLGRPEISRVLAAAAAPRPRGQGLDIWLKLDAGTDAWYQKMDRSRLPHASLLAGIDAFVRTSPVTIQTMLCSVDGKGPSDAERKAWESILLGLASYGKDVKGSLVSGVRRVQLYGKARPAPEDPVSQELPLAFLEKRAGSLAAALEAAGTPVPIEVFP